MKRKILNQKEEYERKDRNKDPYIKYKEDEDIKRIRKGK